MRIFDRSARPGLAAGFCVRLWCCALVLGLLPLSAQAALSALQALASVTLTQNHASYAFTPVIGSGGSPVYTYSIAPALPAGMSLNTNTGAITGTPTAVSSSQTYTVTVTDANSSTASNTFSMAVGSALTATQALASVTLTQNHASSAFTPVIGSGGSPVYTYSIAPALPAGMSLSSATGSISGTPVAALSSTTYTVTVTDALSATASNTFALTVNTAVTATQSVASATVTQNSTITSFWPISGAGGTAPLRYSISPGLPAGLSLASGTGAVSGTPSAASPSTTYTVTVTDANGATASNTFQMTVTGVLAATQSVASLALVVNQAMATVTPVTGAGGTAPLHYAIAPALPAGLSLNTNTGAITGTPTAVSSSQTYTVTVTDANSSTASNTFSMAVGSALTATQALPARTLAQNQAATPFTPIVGTSGAAPLSYSIAPVLPAGLSLNTSTGAISGTPTAAASNTTYTVTVTDANSYTASNTFSLTVIPTAYSGATPSVAGTGGSPTIPAATGSATISVAGSAPCGFSAAQFVTPASIGGTLPQGYRVAQSAFAFNTTNCGGGNAVATLSVSYAQAMPAGTVLYKYGPQTPGGSATWFPLTGATLSPDGLTFTYSITDNGVGDSDATVGVISDPILPMAPIATSGAQSIPTLSDYALALLAALAAWVGLRYHPARRTGR